MRDKRRFLWNDQFLEHMQMSWEHNLFSLLVGLLLRERQKQRRGGTCPFLAAPVPGKVSHYTGDLDPGIRHLHQGGSRVISGKKKKTSQKLWTKRKTEWGQSTPFLFLTKAPPSQGRDTVVTLTWGPGHKPPPQTWGDMVYSNRNSSHNDFLQLNEILCICLCLSALLPGSNRIAGARLDRMRKWPQGISAAGTGSFGNYFQNTPERKPHVLVANVAEAE